jgi:hypothetical protein
MEWEPFMRDVVKMPLSMLDAVQYAVKAKWWENANDPLEQVRQSAAKWAKRRSQLDRHKSAAATGE